MNKKLYALLCLLTLTRHSDGMDKNNFLKKLSLGLAIAGTADGLLHLLTRPFLYKGIWTKPASRKSLPEGQEWENYHLKNGGNAVIRKPSDNADIQSVWICFSGHKYDVYRRYFTSISRMFAKR